MGPCQISPSPSVIPKGLQEVGVVPAFCLLMPKTWPLCTGAKSNLRDRVLGEVEKNRFIALTGKGEHSGLMPSKTVCPNLGDLVRSFIVLVQRWGCC